VALSRAKQRTQAPLQQRKFTCCDEDKKTQKTKNKKKKYCRQNKYKIKMQEFIETDDKPEFAWWYCSGYKSS
jgi:hypothetical protein